MKNIYIIISSFISSFISPIFSLSEITPKLCINCKFFTNSLITDNKHGKCSLFPKMESNIDYFVNGIIEKNVDYYYCSTARSYYDMCGKNGKKYISALDKNDTFPNV